MLNATTRGTFLPSLFSLSSQCRFAGWRGEVVERERKRERKLERPGREKKKDNRRSVGVEGRKAKEQASSLSVYRADRNVENDPGNRAVITHRTTFPFIFSPLLFARLETAVGDRCCVFVLNGPRAPVPREGLVLLVLASERLRGEGREEEEVEESRDDSSFGRWWLTHVFKMIQC